MFLTRLILRNIRSIENLELSFSRPECATRQWTILLGENGAGKSTVLRSIALGLAGSNALPELLINSEDWIRRGSETASIEMDLTTADGESRHLALNLRRGEALSQTFARNRDSALLHARRMAASSLIRQ